MRRAPGLVLAALVLAGCASPAPPAGPGSAAPGGPVVAWAQRASGAAAALPADLASWAIVPVAPGAEPNIGIAASGAAFVTAFNDVWRSTDGGRSWAEAFHYGSPEPAGSALEGALFDPLQTMDPNRWVDPVTSRVFVSHLGPAPFPADCAYGAWSDDEGETWTQQPLACGTPLEDHQKVATGPRVAGGLPDNPAYANVVYFCYNKIASTDCAVSNDGGLTWPVDQPAAVDARDGCAGINGHQAVAPDGTVFVPIGHRSFTYAAQTGKPLLCDAPYVAASHDNGLTWAVRRLPDTFGGPDGIDPSITVTPDGTAYIAYAGAGHRQYLARSRDGFATVDGPWPVSAPHLRSTVFSALTSGDDGRIALAYLGTPDTAEEPSNATNGTRWHLFVAQSWDAGAEDPTFVTQQVTAPDRPVQIGCVWLYGGASDCRNLLDFIDAKTSPEGRVYVVFTDGCTDRCDGVAGATDQDSRSSLVSVAFVERGPSLSGATGTLGPPRPGSNRFQDGAPLASDGAGILPAFPR